MPPLSRRVHHKDVVIDFLVGSPNKYTSANLPTTNRKE